MPSSLGGIDKELVTDTMCVTYDIIHSVGTLKGVPVFLGFLRRKVYGKVLCSSPKEGGLTYEYNHSKNSGAD
jgi:hypothetical protein